MKRNLMGRSLSIFAAVVFAMAVPAYAGVISVNFSGVVIDSTGATGESAGNTIFGSFSLDDVSGQFSSFVIDTRSAPDSSLPNNGLGFFDAIYQDQISSVSTGGNVNSTFTLDLSSLTEWPVGTDTIYSLLGDSSQIPGNLDTSGDSFTSTFGYYMADGAGNNVVQLDADLTSVEVAPEPASFALLGTGLLAMTFAVRRSRKA